MLKPIRYSSTNGALHIGGRKYKLSIFTREGCARLHLGDRNFHFGNWGCCQRRGDFVVFRRTENIEKWRVKVYSLWIIILAVFACQA